MEIMYYGMPSILMLQYTKMDSPIIVFRFGTIKNLTIKESNLMSHLQILNLKYSLKLTLDKTLLIDFQNMETSHVGLSQLMVSELNTLRDIWSDIH